MALALALGCTIVVGLTLMRLADGAAAKEEPVPFSPRLVTLGVIVGAGFIATVGPGLDLSGGLGVR